MPSAQPTTGPVLSPNNGRQRQYNKFCGGHKKRRPLGLLPVPGTGTLKALLTVSNHLYSRNLEYNLYIII